MVKQDTIHSGWYAGWWRGGIAACQAHAYDVVFLKIDRQVSWLDHSLINSFCLMEFCSYGLLDDVKRFMVVASVGESAVHAQLHRVPARLCGGPCLHVRSMSVCPSG